MKKRDFDFQFCWTAITADGAMTGGYSRTLEEARAECKDDFKYFEAGATPVDVLMSLRHHGNITDDHVLAAMKSESRRIAK